MRVHALRKGDKIGVVATGFAVDKRKVLLGLSYLQSKGYRVVLGRSLFKRSGYFAGSEKDRSEDLNRMVEDPEIRAVFFARGGFGTSKILNSFHFHALRRDPKPLIGYSDLTSLFLAITALLKIPVFYGPVVAELGSRRAFNSSSLWTLLKGDAFRIPIPSKKWILKGGIAEGRIIGGCLTLISNLLGTEFEPNFHNKILFLEEVGEEVYRIERLFNHLKMTGKFQKLKGLIVGEFIRCPQGVNAPGRRGVKEIIEEYFGSHNIPILFHFPAGHCRNKITIPLGGQTVINTRKLFIEFRAG